MVCKIRSLGLYGVGGYQVTAECDLSPGLPSFEVVGLPDTAVREARERVRSAAKNSGFEFPTSRITINLAPADRKKVGTLYDLPILVGILASQDFLPAGQLHNAAFVGELSLAGELRPVPGILPMALAAQRAGIAAVYVPADNAPEATLAEGLTVFPVENIAQLVQHLQGKTLISPAQQWVPTIKNTYHRDFSDVKGQFQAKRCLEIAAAGGHSVLMCGAPGSGKSMLAQRLPSILPDLTDEEAIQTTEVYSVLGMTSRQEPMMTQRPFRSPHQTISTVGLAGGGTNPRPGEISMAHNGVLFLDELPEFRKDVLEVLRQPLEEGRIQISRAAGSVSYPARFMLVCAMNPCKCGWHGHPTKKCRCTPTEVERYTKKISGPLLDRIDLYVNVPSLEYDELSSTKVPAESSEKIRERVNAARKIQIERFQGVSEVTCNARMGQNELRRFCVLEEDSKQMLRVAFDRMGLTARGYDRILRVARTIADLDNGSEKVTANHIAEALQYRTFTFLNE